MTSPSNEEDPQTQYNQFVEHQQAMNESVSHEVHLWIDQLDDEGLDKVGSLMWAAMNFTGWGAQMLGILQATRKFKYGRCMVCGVNHDKEQQEVIDETHAKMTADGTQIPGSPFRMGDAAAFEAQAQSIIGRTFPEYLRLCSEYNVTSNVDQDGQVFCKNCNMRYPSLDDRMMNAPDSCSGCHEFAGKGVKFPPPDKQ